VSITDPLVLYLARHGQTILNAQGRLRGHENPDLDELGHRQASALARQFRNTPVGHIAATPLLRAQQTAAAIAAPHGLPVATASHLLDRDYGPWAGQPTAEVVARFGSVDAAPGVEPWDGFRARALVGLREALDASMADVVLIVAHDAVNRALLQDLFDLDPLATPQHTGCWNRLERTAGRWNLALLDQCPELADD
jgi:broad specificity phosphatase PhoE